MKAPAAKILILDDDPTITELLADILQQDGYKVNSSNSPKDALFLARQFLPDLLLLDIMMPELDGLDVCRFFKDDSELRHIRIVMLTARDDRESRIAGYRAGADSYLTKPFDLEELRLILENQVRNKIEHDKTVRELLEQTLTDRDTKAYNRKYIRRRIEEELKRGDRHHREIGLILVHLDNLKSVNLHYGFTLGVEITKKVSEILNQELRVFDLLGRYSTDSFVILLPETPEDGIKTVAARLQNTISSLVFPRNRRVAVQAAIHPLMIDSKTTAEELYRQIDLIFNEQTPQE